MIHDLDVVLSLVDSDVESIEAVGVPVLTGRVDIANARLRFANGCIANLTASRISRDRVRKIRFFQPIGLRVDRLRGAEGRGVPAGQGGTRRDAGDRGRRGRRCANEEPLKRELADFVEAIATRRAPVVTGEDGRRALALAQRLADKMATDTQPRRHDWITTRSRTGDDLR